MVSKAPENSTRLEHSGSVRWHATGAVERGRTKSVGLGASNYPPVIPAHLRLSQIMLSNYPFLSLGRVLALRVDRNRSRCSG